MATCLCLVSKIWNIDPPALNSTVPTHEHINKWEKKTWKIQRWTYIYSYIYTCENKWIGLKWHAWWGFRMANLYMCIPLDTVMLQRWCSHINMLGNNSGRHLRSIKWFIHLYISKYHTSLHCAHHPLSLLINTFLWQWITLIFKYNTSSGLHSVFKHFKLFKI